MASVQIFTAAVDAQARLIGRRKVKALLDDVLVTARARVLVGPYTTGALARSLKKRTNSVPTGEEGFVYSDLPYSTIVEKGARRHLILPRGPWRLRFFWRRVGHVVHLESVRHPGQKGKHYLQDALLLHAPRHGFTIRRR